MLDHAGQVNVFLVAALLSPGGWVDAQGRPDVGTLRAGLRERVAALPSLNRCPVTIGRRHRWVEALPDLDDHIRLLDPVDGFRSFEQLCGDLMTVPLALDRPPWELLVLEGAGDGGVAIVLRIHHVIADGMAALAIMQGLFERVGADDQGQVPNLMSANAVAATSSPPSPRTLSQVVSGMRRILATVARRGVGPTVLLGDRSPDRGVIFVDADLAALHGRVRLLGATVNDALLASIAAGYVAALSIAGEGIPAELPISVPVALRRRGTSRNQVGVMLVRLPLAVSDPDARLRLIAARTRAEKGRAREQGTLEFMRGPRGARIMDTVARRQHLVAGFVTNVPGTTDLLRLAGAPIDAIWPVAVLAGNVRLGVAAASYAGKLRCGIHFDEMAVPGAEFARAMSEELTRLTT